MAYYFLASMITKLHLESRLTITFTDFKNLLEQNLSSRDKNEMTEVLRVFDMENLRLFLRKLSITSYGNWSQADLEQLLVFPSGVEYWLEEALDQVKSSPHADIDDFHVQFFENKTGSKSPSSRVLERIWIMQWVSGYFRAKIMGRLSSFYKEPGSSHPRIEALLADLESSNLDAEYQKFKSIFDHDAKDIEILSRHALEWQLQFLEEEFEADTFSLERILAHLVQLAYIERWQNRHAPDEWDPRLSAMKALKMTSS